jgi:hypothetical protein
VTTIAGLEWLECTVQMPLLPLPVRSVLVPVPGGRVLLSPGSTLSQDALVKAGSVTDLVATSLLHTGGMRAAAAAHPQARLWGVRGAAQKHPELRWSGVLGVDAWPHDDVLGAFPLEGIPELSECVFLHRPSRTLLVTDLAFNLTESRGVGAWLILSLFGTYRRFGVSRLFLKRVRDRRAFEASLARIAALDFENLVPSHGQPVLGGARARFLEALRERGIRL